MWLEKPRVLWKALDVLAHQIVAMTFENENLTVEKAWKTIKRSYIYKDLTYDEFLNVLNFLNEIKIIRFKENRIKRTRKGLFYFIENISMIPDEKSYIVIDINTRNRIGILHEEFIAKHGNPGTIFILRGMPWKIEKIERDKVYVSLENDFESAIPSWEGELIPVYFEVAQLANEIRKKLIFELEDLKEQGEYFVPDNNKIFIEQYKDWIILHCPYGSLVNDTLARILSYKISNEYGLLVGIKTDPYRILIKNPSLTKEKMKEFLLSLDPEEIEDVLRESIVNTDLFLWKFVHVAKRFGVIRKDADYSKLTIRRISEELRETPVFEETINELVISKFDLENTKKIIEKINNGDIEIIIIDKEDVSPLAKLALTQIVSDVLLTKEKWGEILKLVKERLENTELSFYCLNCNRYLGDYKVKDAIVKCPYCKSEYLSVTKKREKEKYIKVLNRIRRKKKLTKEDTRNLDYLYTSAELYKIHGKKFLMVLAGKGVSIISAMRILRREIDEESLIKKILEEEKRFFKIRRFI